jgi:hypothetical protein
MNHWKTFKQEDSCLQVPLFLYTKKNKAQPKYLFFGKVTHLSRGEHWCWAEWHQDVLHRVQVTLHPPATTHVSCGGVLVMCATFHHLQEPKTTAENHFDPATWGKWMMVSTVRKEKLTMSLLLFCSSSSPSPVAVMKTKPPANVFQDLHVCAVQILQHNGS